MISKIHPLGNFLNLVLAGLRLGLKNYQVEGKWILDDYSYFIQKSLNYINFTPPEWANFA
ncbi:hypothetical protein THERMOT_906 [Bathymodiolus thermophilus thioautotrophic gill symbiont]|uniref:Uncharacterized protein n=1 Tax=Bathymodiolus thermophilus thioautotrophic gill symbiont TaxID=2360 RepID=A0A8H8XB34_9GAMM|nr:hypothetical protein THERMOT_906 [Bathymodiolus thermophilus thioautotrophic gill symbiont]CAB5499000.1 hypothetical protein THERMOS_949 [Bathymodiolus thermophilus thioautotrophic gill symbiont]